MKTVTIVAFLVLSTSVLGHEVHVPTHFQSLKAALACIAKRSSPEEHAATVEQFLAKSSFTLHHFVGDTGLTVMICEPVVFTPGGMIYSRGASGNGAYYVLLQSRDRWSIVGVLYGNTYRVAQDSTPPRINTSAHFAADETEDFVYEWDGSVFQEIERYRTVRGTRRP